MSDSNVFSPDFREFVELLIKHEVKYLITGGYAVKNNGKQLVAVFNDFGLSSFGLTSNHFSKPEQVIQIGYPPHRIDILTSIDGVSFSEAFSSKNIVDIDGL